MGTVDGRSIAGGRYVVRRKLGEGAQKVVFLVRDTQLERECALSQLKAGQLDEAKLLRIRREAQAMARLDAHETIVTVYDMGVEDGVPFMVCEYVAGGDLETKLNEHGAIKPERAVAIAKDVCRALSVAHGAGIIHRDVKPGNVWLTDSGTAKLGDFGLALSANQARVTTEGVIVGTPYYMAPEQALSGTVDARCDLYSLGCVLYELLTEVPPYEGASVVEVIGKHIHATPAPPSRKTPDVPPALDDIVLALLAKRPEDRPQSAAQVLAQLEALDAQPAAAEPAEAGPLARLADTSFVGRTNELDGLKAALGQAVAGQGCTRTISGEPGVGKSRLVHEVSIYARLSGIRVLTGSCEAADGAPPYLPFLEGLDASAAQLPADALGAQRGTLGRILPALAEQTGNAESSDDADRYDVFRAVVALLRHLAQPGGLLLILEDIHWADKLSLLLLEYLAAHISDVPLLIIGTYRDVEISRTHPLRETLTSLRRLAGHERITLKRLEPAAARALIDNFASLSESSADAILKQTEGHPLFIEEVLKHLVEEGALDLAGVNDLSRRELSELGIPEGIRDVIGRRLSRLSDGCNRMLGRASALTNVISWPLLAAICDCDEDELLDCLDEALAARLVRERRGDSAGAYQFTHALIRQTLYEELSTPRRARLHRKIGEAIEGLYASNLEPHLSELAHHFYEASGSGDLDKFLDYAERAGRRSTEQMAFEDAAHHYERALQALDEHERTDAGELRARLHTEKGKALKFICAWADARQEFEKALAYVPVERAAQRAELLLHYAVSHLWTMNMPGLIANAKEALTIVDASEHPNIAAAATAWLAIGSTSDGKVEEAVAQYDQAVELADDMGDPLVTQAFSLYPQIPYWRGEFDETITQCNELGRLARVHHDATAAMLLMPLLGLSLGATGRYREADQVFADSVRYGIDHKIRGLHARAIGMSAGNKIDTFDFDGAAGRANEANEMARGLSFPPVILSTELDLIFMSVACGDVADAERRMPETAAGVAKSAGWHQWIFALRLALARAAVANAKQDWRTALEAANECLEWAQKVGRRKHLANGLALRASALIGLGKKTEAIADLQAAVETARQLRYQTLFIRRAAELLQHAGSDALLEEARAAVSTVAAELDDPAALRRFNESAPVKRIVV